LGLRFLKVSRWNADNTAIKRAFNGTHAAGSAFDICSEGWGINFIAFTLKLAKLSLDFHELAHLRLNKRDLLFEWPLFNLVKSIITR